MKEYTITPEELSELSFVAQHHQASHEIYMYWQTRRNQLLEDALKKRTLSHDTHIIDFSHLWTEGKILFSPKPQPKKDHAKPELQKEPEQGTEAR